MKGGILFLIYAFFPFAFIKQYINVLQVQRSCADFSARAQAAMLTCVLRSSCRRAARSWPSTCGSAPRPRDEQGLRGGKGHVTSKGHTRRTGRAMEGSKAARPRSRLLTCPHALVHARPCNVRSTGPFPRKAAAARMRLRAVGNRQRLADGEHRTAETVVMRGRGPGPEPCAWTVCEGVLGWPQA